MSVSRKKVVIFTMVVMVVLVMLFNRSMCWLDTGITWHKLFVGGLSIFGVLGIPLLMGYVEPMRMCAVGIIESIRKGIQTAIVNRKKIGAWVLVYAVVIFMTWLAERFVISERLGGFNYSRLLFFWGCASLMLLLIAFRKMAAQRPEALFALAALVLGMTTILSCPGYIGISPDDETHYVRSISLASVFDYVKYEAESKMLDDYPSLVYGIRDERISYEEMTAYAEELNTMFGPEFASNEDIFDIENEDAIGYRAQLGTYSLAYVPSAVGIIIGKGLHLPFTQVLICGKMAILLTYIGIIYFAIKRLKYGKTLLAFIALTPTTLFLASSYSYDWWVTAFLLAGFSYYISELQYSERKLSNKNLFCMLLCFLLGILPKWVYGILMATLFFIPKNKFASQKQRTGYYMIMFLGMLLGVVFLVCPVFIRGLGQGDIRGGADVNATLQLILVCTHPWEYAQVMLEFMKSYISLDNASQYLTNMGYLGDGVHATLLVVVMGILTFLDRSEEKVRMPVIRFVNLFTIFCGIALVITVFYLVYTPVGSDAVLGCQARYLIPFLFPAIYFIGVDGTSTAINRNTISIVSIGIAGAVYLLNYWSVYISLL
ncbi:MAG: DUF2142 domain-containing protein [Lachnospiraceae bacterium]